LRDAQLGSLLTRVTESFDRILIPAQAPGHPGFSPTNISWMLERAPSETLVLRPAPEAHVDEPTVKRLDWHPGGEGGI
jgi:hypothetical protein